MAGYVQTKQLADRTKKQGPTSESVKSKGSSAGPLKTFDASVCATRRRKAMDPEMVAYCSGLQYLLDDQPGFSRREKGKSRKKVKEFDYLDIHGRLIKSESELERIRALVIPPAWRDVWISPHSDSHLQVTGIDARGRKQYRYHEKWREVRDQSKFERLISFSQCLPKVREQVQADLAKEGLPREKVLATVVRLLEATCIRVGNETYARDNDSYGLTTLRSYHVEVDQCEIRFEFRGKSGKDHRIALNDCALADIVENCKARPGELLFQYVDESGEDRRVTSSDVNRYLRKISGRNISAKDFRTWWGTVLTALALRERDLPKSPSGAKRIISGVVKEVAAHLGNTPTVCRKCYIHPAILSAFADGRVLGRIVRGKSPGNPAAPPAGLLPEEKAVVRFLKQEWQRA